jgi:hypothetical protein
VKGRSIKILEMFRICQMTVLSPFFETVFYLISKDGGAANRIVIKNNIKAV